VAWIATRQDLIALGGLPADAYQPDSRELDAVHDTANLFELRGHGLSGASVRFAARAGGTLAAPLDALTWYPVAATTDPDFFALTGVTLTDAGTGTIVVLENFWPKIDVMLAARSGWLVGWHKATRGPWSTPPTWAPMIVAQLVAADAARALRLPASRYPVDQVFATADKVQPFLDRIGRGEPFDDGVGPIDATPSVAEMGARLVTLDGRGYLDTPEDGRV
jgi:hypothetical protein